MRTEWTYVHLDVRTHEGRLVCCILSACATALESGSIALEAFVPTAQSARATLIWSELGGERDGRVAAKARRVP